MVLLRSLLVFTASLTSADNLKLGLEVLIRADGDTGTAYELDTSPSLCAREVNLVTVVRFLSFDENNFNPFSYCSFFSSISDSSVFIEGYLVWYIYGVPDIWLFRRRRAGSLNFNDFYCYMCAR